MISKDSSHNALEIESGFFRATFFYDVADTIDLTKLSSVGGVNVARAQLELKAHSAPNYIKFVVPPIAANLPEVSISDLQAQARVKIYDYGTVSIRYSFPFSGSWEDFNRLSVKLRQATELSQMAESTLKIILEEAKNAMEGPYATISENYFTLNVQKFARPVTAQELLAEHKSELTSLLLGETRKVSEQEETNTLSVHFSYTDDDLVVVQWDAAFIFDTEKDSEAAESILEFANTQLVQYLTYDERLDAELDAVYKLEPIKSTSRSIFERRHAEQRAQSLRYFLADIREISDRANNSLKIIGDAYYARMYRGASARLGLTEWQKQIDTKLETLQEIYQFVTDQAQHAQSEFIEMAIVGLIALEIVLSLIKH